MAIHETAMIDPRAILGQNNDIGPYVIIEGPLRLGNGNSIGPFTVITGNTTIGDNNRIHGHVYIGDLPQDLSYEGGESYVKIGNNNELREFVTVHRGTKTGSATVIGDNNYLMVSSHVGHNCRLGNNIVMVNCASLGGYVEIHDHAFLAGFTMVHQFTRVGSYSICGLATRITKDVPPFMMVSGSPVCVNGLNLVGLQRKGFTPEQRMELKRAYKLLYCSGFSISHSLQELKKYEQDANIRLLIDFIQGSKRGILLKPPRNRQEE